MVLVSLAWIALLDTSGNGRGIFENRWAKGDFAVATNDTVARFDEAGDVVAFQIAGPGESCLLRRKRFTFDAPCRVRIRMRATPGKFGDAFPSVHVVFDPPPLDDPWWKTPVDGANPGGGAWREGLTGFVFHFSTLPCWRRFGITSSLENPPGVHSYSPPRTTWVTVEIRLEPKRTCVVADGTEVATTPADLTSVRTFAVGIGDQASTLVELDELRVTAEKR